MDLGWTDAEAYAILSSCCIRMSHWPLTILRPLSMHSRNLPVLLPSDGICGIQISCVAFRHPCQKWYRPLSIT